MPNKTSIELNKCWVCERMCDVTDEEMTWVLLQEPGFIGFGAVMKSDICFPPKVEPDWLRISDLRLFGEKGEWHVWRDWDGKHYARLLKFQKIDDNDTLTEYHILWGNDVKPATPPWIRLVEDRGSEIWLPLAGLDTEKDLPVHLKLKQIVDYDPKSHLAGIVDAGLVALVCIHKDEEKIMFPPSSLSCS